MRQVGIAAAYMRGGTSKGVFFEPAALPGASASDPAARDRLLLRVVGSPDPYGKHIDGMGGATSSTSKVVLVSRSTRADCDVDYLFGAVNIERPLIDWSGSCGNLVAAVGPFAIARGLLDAPRDGWATVRIWQANIGKRIIATVPMQDGEPVETGDFELDGVAFPAAEIALEFVDPAGGDTGGGGVLFPTGQLCESLPVPGVGTFEVTLINAGNPTIFVHAHSLGLGGCELQADVNTHSELLARLEHVRAHAAVRMGLAPSAERATADSPATPKLAFVAPPREYRSAAGRVVSANDHDLSMRILSMGKLHHAITGTGGVAVAAAAAIAGTVVSKLLPQGSLQKITVGHPSGVLRTGATARGSGAGAQVGSVRMSRSARRLMEGLVLVPAEFAR